MEGLPEPSESNGFVNHGTDYPTQYMPEYVPYERIGWVPGPNVSNKPLLETSPDMEAAENKTKNTLSSNAGSKKTEENAAASNPWLPDGEDRSPSPPTAPPVLAWKLLKK